MSAVSFDAWAVGTDWGQVEKENDIAALQAALNEGINLFDTADFYGDVHSEKLLAQLRANVLKFSISLPKLVTV